MRVRTHESTVQFATRENVHATGECVHTLRRTHSNCHDVGANPLHNKRKSLVSIINHFLN